MQLPARLGHTRMERSPVSIKLLKQLLLTLLERVSNGLASCCTLCDLMLSEGCDGDCGHLLQQPVHRHHLQYAILYAM